MRVSFGKSSNVMGEPLPFFSLTNRYCSSNSNRVVCSVSRFTTPEKSMPSILSHHK